MYMSPNKHIKKVVVFDMDETLGCFYQLGMFTSTLEDNLHRKLTNDEFNILMDLFPLYQRTNIIPILNYIKKKKQEHKCFKVYIYTNNQGPKHWALQIKNYFEYKINYPLFDKVIHAWKVNGILVEKCRTSHNKSVADLLKCTKLPKNTQFCFLDDKYHPHMLNTNVLYLHLNEYQYHYEPNYLFNTFKKHFHINDVYIEYLKDRNENILLEQFPEKSNINHEKNISKQILIELQLFFKDNNRRITRRANEKSNFTRKYKDNKKYKHIY